MEGRIKVDKVQWEEYGRADDMHAGGEIMTKKRKNATESKREKLGGVWMVLGERKHPGSRTC